MPPRRSSRSARASVEPSAAESLPPKRKRAQVAEPDEKENVAKPASRTRKTSARSSAAPTSKSRAATRSKVSLPDVQESEGESSDPPKRKRARPSNDGIDEQGEDNTEGMAEMKVKRGRTLRVSKPHEVDNDEDNSDAKLPTRRTSTKQTNKSSERKASTTATRPGRQSRSARQEQPANSDDNNGAYDQEGEQDVKPALGDRRRSVRSSGADPSCSNRTPDAKLVDVSEVSDDEDEAPIKGRKSVSRKSKGASKKQARFQVQDSESSGEDLEPPTSAQPRTRADVNKDDEVLTQAGIVEDPSPQEAEEEERSLFDPPPTPSQMPLTQSQEPTGPKARLVIHKIVLVNFKSYAGRQEIGPFHKSFSAIVGPNGSGKSNTIDALLFVFGYRASKMRQARVSELIHNSARYPDLDECSVEVHFREIIDLPGPDAFKVVSGSQLVVERRAFKNNSSIYAVDKATSSYTEVQTLLKGRGIDLDHKRFLILQGEVESIAQMKPKAPSEHEDGLLEYLEDIIGTSKYKEPIDDALIESERLQEERAIKMNRLRLVEKEKAALDAKKREAENYLKLKNEHVKAQSRLWQWYIWQSLLVEEQLLEKIDEYDRKLTDEREKNKDDVTHLELLTQHFLEREKAYKEVQEAAQEASKDLKAHEKKEVGFDERYKHSKSRAKKLTKTLQDDKAAKAKAERDIIDSQAKIEREQNKLADHEAKLEKEEKVLEGIRDSLKDKTQGFHQKIEAKQKELQPWTAKINAKQAEVDVATSERDALSKKAEAVKAASQEAEDTLEQLQGDQEVKVQEQAKLESRRSHFQKQKGAAEKRLRDAQAVLQGCRSKASSTRQKIDEARASQTENKSQNKVLDTLTKLRDAGRIQGFHGRLGSLGTIPDKYDIAITTACGMLNHMVVDKVDQGQACIEYLRNQNIGRASFLVLEKLDNSHGMEKTSTPENVPRLFDLIKPNDPRLAPAFYKAVGNTLVANDMDQANRIAFGGSRRWRVVTLAGQMIEASGAMSGGGTYVAKGGMSSKPQAASVRPEQLRKYEQDSEEAARELQMAQEEIKGAEAALDEIVRSGPEIDMALQKLVLDIEQGNRRIAEAQKRVRDLKSQNKPNTGDLARIKQLETDIASTTSELTDLQSKSSKIEEAIAELEEKILEIGGSRLLTQKSLVDGIRLHINLANDEITKAEVTKAKAEKDAAKLTTVITNNVTAIEDVERELEEMNERLEEVRAYLSDLREKVEKAKEAAENEKEDLDQLKVELDEKEAQIKTFRKTEMELQQKLTDAHKENKDNERIMVHWQKEHDQLTLEEVDDDEDDEEDDNSNGGENKAAEDEEMVDVADAEIKVKPEPGTRKRSEREHTPPHELHKYAAEELQRFKKADLLADVALLDDEVKNARPDLSVLKEYKRREAEFFSRAQDVKDITEQRDAQKKMYDSLRKQRLDEFMAGFNLISLKLKEMYQMITLGGNAELELVDSLDPFSEGIIFSVMPPKKSWKNISNLSGGEKTLSSLALVFALHVFKPTPLYFMDEIDAALDFRNVSIVANYIKDRTKNAQFIIISLRNDMFELSHRLIGIYKTANATRSISIDNHSLLAAVPRAVSSVNSA